MINSTKIDHFGGRYGQIMLVNRIVELAEASETAEANEAAGVFKASKDIKVIQVFELNFILFFETKFFWYNHEKL